METPQTVVFTQRAFNAIVTETIDKHPIETGGIFLGYVFDNGTWIVVENISPGQDSTHRRDFFEYDADFVTYLSNVVANQYKGNLQILGLWHRHPGSFNQFSRTDDQTNLDYAKDQPCGAISALVNCDPKMRITMYHVSKLGEYTKTDWYVDDGDIIPQELLELHYASAEEMPTFDEFGIIGQSVQKGNSEEAQYNPSATELGSNGHPYTLPMAIRDFRKIFKQLITGVSYD